MWSVTMIRDKFLDVCWDSHFTKSRVCVKYLIYLAGNFITKNIEEMVSETASLDLMLIK